MSNQLSIRNSTAEFLIFMVEGKEDGVQVLYQDETIWCTQDAIALLFDKSRSTIAEHLQNIFKEGNPRRGSKEHPSQQPCREVSKCLLRRVRY
jgi:hypothetical protein